MTIQKMIKNRLHIIRSNLYFFAIKRASRPPMCQAKYTGNEFSVQLEINWIVKKTNDQRIVDKIFYVRMTQ